MITYIILTSLNELYCGKTTKFEDRMRAHEYGMGWFKYHNRRIFNVVLTIDGDYEKRIKKFGVRHFLDAISGVTYPTKRC